MKMSKSINIKVYFNTYDRFVKGKYYPHISRRAWDDGETEETFMLIDVTWHHVPNEYPTILPITRMDKINKRQILSHLNKKYSVMDNNFSQITAKMCISRLKSEGLTERLAGKRMNDMTRGEFAYTVIEMMMCCAMEPQAEWIVSLLDCPKRGLYLANSDGEIM